MTHADATTPPNAHAGPPADAPSGKVTPGRVAVWFFVATEVMFFTALIGAYIVLRAGSPEGSYSNLYPPSTSLERLRDKHGVVLRAAGGGEKAAEEALRAEPALSEAATLRVLESAPHGVVAVLDRTKAEDLKDGLQKSAGGLRVDVIPLESWSWPRPFDPTTNPLSVTLAVGNTLILLSSSFLLNQAIAAIRRGKRARCSLLLLAAVCLGSLFLAVQVFEYRELAFEGVYPPGVSASGKFRPDSSLFASCFYTMTGLHGLHVAAGVIVLTLVFLGSLLGRFTADNHGTIENAGIYWHFVDAVWLVLLVSLYMI